MLLFVMLRQQILAVKASLPVFTDLATVRLVIQMSSFVVFAISNRGKPPLAMRTLVRGFLGVNALVDLKIPILSEPSAAFFVWANKFARDMQMSGLEMLKQSLLAFIELATVRALGYPVGTSLNQSFECFILGPKLTLIYRAG